MSKMTSKQKASIVGQRAARPSRVSHRLSIIAPPCPVLKIPSLKLHDKNKERRVIDIMRPFFLMDDQIDLLKDVFWEDLKNGLSKSPERVHKSSLLMQDSYVTETLNGKEKGQYLGVDLGGTTLRIALVKLHKKRITDQINDAFHVPEAVRIGHCVDLFDFIATCLVEFLANQDIIPNGIPLGFSFSYPMKQLNLTTANLIAWNKSITCSGAVGHNVVDFLTEALKRRSLHVKVTAICNDTTATLIAGTVLEQDCGIGLIIGTGTNACYSELVQSVEKFAGDPKAKETIVVLEWGGFGDKGGIEFIRTRFDQEVDKDSVVPKSFMYEKYISAFYVGELMRHLILYMATEGPFFRQHPSKKLKQFGVFTAEHMIAVEEDTLAGGSMKCRKVLDHLDLMYVKDDIRALQYVAAVVSFRAAQLVSMGIAGLLEKMTHKGRVTIAVDGAIYKFHPRIRFLMDYYTARFAPGRDFSYFTAEDGGACGAALIGAIAHRKQERADGKERSKKHHHSPHDQPASSRTDNSEHRHAPSTASSSEGGISIITQPSVDPDAS